MTGAFIFDMDGVLVDSENIWQKRGISFMGEKVSRAIQSQIQGLTVQVSYRLACEHGLAMTEDEYRDKFNQQAAKVYAEAEVTPGIDKLLETLKKLGYKIGLVTSSPKMWVDWVLPKIANADAIEYILSIGDNPDLKSKPAPDGYLRAIEALGSTPEQTIVVEDSNNGIASAKASGAYAVGFRQHHDAEYKLNGADKYVDSMKELEEYINLPAQTFDEKFRRGTNR